LVHCNPDPTVEWSLKISVDNKETRDVQVRESPRGTRFRDTEISKDPSGRRVLPL